MPRFGTVVSEIDPDTGLPPPDAANLIAAFGAGYTGREWDPDSQLFYYRARWYDPNVGRFISEDPIGFDGQDVNVQRYVGNFVTGATDPSGLISDEVLAANHDRLMKTPRPKSAPYGMDFSYFWQGYWNSLNPWSPSAQAPVDTFDHVLRWGQYVAIPTAAVAGGGRRGSLLLRCGRGRHDDGRSRRRHLDRRRAAHVDRIPGRPRLIREPATPPRRPTPSP